MAPSTAKIKVGNEELVVPVPDSPAVLPSELQSKWRSAYIDAYKRAAEDNSRPASDRPQYALQEANRILRVPPVETEDDARKLASWQVIQRGERVVNGRKVFFVVTIEGRKHSFDVGPAKSEKVAAPAGGGANGTARPTTPPAARQPGERSERSDRWAAAGSHFRVRPPGQLPSHRHRARTPCPEHP